jgi:hypothetical protein
LLVIETRAIGIVLERTAASYVRVQGRQIFDQNVMNDIKAARQDQTVMRLIDVQTVKGLTLSGASIAHAASIRRALGIFFRFQVTKFSGTRLRFDVLDFTFFLTSFFLLHLFSYLLFSVVRCGGETSRACTYLCLLILIIFHAKPPVKRLKHRSSLILQAGGRYATTAL